MDALRERKFFSKSNNKLPKISVSLNEDSFVSVSLKSVLFRVLRRVVVLSSHKGQWRKNWDIDSIFILQLQKDEHSFENCDWIYVHVDGSVLDLVVSLV